MQTLPITKFCAPLPHHEVIARPDLTHWLQKELPCSRLALLSAPAGYGKTTLLSTLPEALPGLHLAWFALDAEDNDPVRFLGGLAEALSAIEPQLKQVIENQLTITAGLISGSSPASSFQQALTILINCIVSRPVAEFILVFDDLHEITNPVLFEALDYLIDKQPPQMHLAISTRYEPSINLNRLRARRQIVELTMQELSFDLEESRRLLNGLLHLGLSSVDLERLQQKTAGWPVGLVLLTSRLRNLPPLLERSVFLEHLRSIDPHTFHYLAEEVLNQQPHLLRSFLLQTSILTELTPDRCRELTGRADAEALLIELYQRNLFLSQAFEMSPVGEAVYQYHALFAEFLQHELEQKTPELCRQLHLKAAKIETMPGRAIGHFLKAQEWRDACQQIEAAGEQFLQQGLQETVLNWISALPVDLANQYYFLMYLQGLALLLNGEMEAARLCLERSLELLDTVQDDAVRGKVLVGLASLSFIRAKFSISAEQIRQAEPYVSGIQEQINFLMLRASLAWFFESDRTRAMEDLSTALKLVKSSSDLRLWFLFALNLGQEFIVLPGMLDLLEAFCETAQDRYAGQMVPLRLGIEDTWASIHLRRGRFEQAIATANDTLMVKQQLGGFTFLGLNASITLVYAYSGLGNYPAANEALCRIQAQVEEAELNRALSGGGLYLLGRLRWLEGNYTEAQQALLQMSILPVRLPLVNTLQEMLAGLVDMAAKRYKQAEGHLLEAVRLQKKEWISEIYGSATLLLACLYVEWEKPQQALDTLESLLVRCEQNNTPGIILQDMPLAVSLLRLAVNKGVRSRQASALLERMNLPLEEIDFLTPRQLEILQLIASGHSNQAIADTLVLSLATVKSHVVHIMNRLGASSRMEAVARARQMHLLL